MVARSIIGQRYQEKSKIEPRELHLYNNKAKGRVGEEEMGRKKRGRIGEKGTGRIRRI